MSEEGTKGFCCTFTNECTSSRRCFMTGEYCSKQNSIQRTRNSSYQKEKPINPQVLGPTENIREITAFVIMSFSDMSDVVYKWRLKPFIESLAKYFYVNEEEKKIYCKSSLHEKTPKECFGVNRIKVVRSDSDPASNYVICSRICQQMQIADLIVVDVSSQNANVFYELGMAVALGKMILPICYSESFYKKEKLSRAIQGENNREQYEHHIGNYLWRKALFEYYGILYKNESSNTKYVDFDLIKDEGIGFDDDAKYNRFPYNECMKGDEDRIGVKAYNLLRDTYNCAKHENNTLVVYTMDRFLNGDQAGQCIVNYYHYIVSRMKGEKCFRGDRVGVLVQGSDILEEDKDSKKPQNLFYKVGEIIYIGVNQATYLALGEKIKTEEFLNVPKCMESESPVISPSEGKKSDSDSNWLIRPQQKKDIIISVKSHIRNRAMLMYPNYPIYVNRMKKGIQKDLLNTYPPKDSDQNPKFFCLYYVMLRNLKYTNEIVVDISGSDTQALFWLGAAHGSDVYAITVKQEKSLEEKERTKREWSQREGESAHNCGTPAQRKLTYPEEKERNIFDVSGLWSAILHAYDTEGFYRQLYLVQSGIERHSRLMLRNMDFYEERIQEILSDTNEELTQKAKDNLCEVHKKRAQENENALESYYRNRFWNRMLKYNRLKLYLPQVDATDDTDKQKRKYTVEWDVNSIAALSHYLSKRTVIGEYRVQPLKRKDSDSDSRYVNFVCIGGEQVPLGDSLSKHIYTQLGQNARNLFGSGYNVIHKLSSKEFECENFKCDTNCTVSEPFPQKRCYKGFTSLDDEHQELYSQHPTGYCAICTHRNQEDGPSKIANFCTSLPQKKKKELSCELKVSDTHIQLAQVILWRDTYSDKRENTFYRVEINGTSGPATFGLSTLFVDDEQKKEVFTENQHWETHNLLCELQKEIRKKFMKAFIAELNYKLDKCIMKLASEDEKKKFEDLENADEEQKKRYFSLVRHSITLYLSTVLYRYFLPFLSEEDIDRICNSASSYIASLKAEDISPFAHKYPYNGNSDFVTPIASDSVGDVISKVEETLEDLLNRFRGVEAFYEVKVKVDANEQATKQDTRKLVDIKRLQYVKNPDNEPWPEISWVNCLFIPEKE